jgi:NCS1 family nucleobase:cation symporter-1
MNYEYRNGWNPLAIIALLSGVLPSLPGFLTALGVLDGMPLFLVELYNYAWFIGAFTSALIYYLLMRNSRSI